MVTMKTCITCENHDATAGICCPTCAAVLNVMVVVKRHWEPGELAKLRDTLRESDVSDAHQSAKNRGATVMAKLLWFIVELARGAKLHPNVLRSRVCDAISDELAGMKEIKDWDDKRGEGAWMKAVANALQEWVGQIQINKA